MADVCSLTFAFDADFSGFARAADSAGARLDALSKASTDWASDTSRAISRAIDGTGRPLNIASGLVAGVCKRCSVEPGADASLEPARAAAEHRRRTCGHRRADQGRGRAGQTRQRCHSRTQGTRPQSLVQQIDAAAAAQRQLRDAQQATNSAIRFGSNELADGHRGAGAAGRKAEPGRGADAVELCAPKVCRGALAGTGPLAGLIGHQGRQRRTGRPVRCARIAAVRRRCEHGVAELFGALCRGWHDRRRALGHRRREGRGGGGRARHRCALGQGGRQRPVRARPR